MRVFSAVFLGGAILTGAAHAGSILHVEGSVEHAPSIIALGEPAAAPENLVAAETTGTKRRPALTVMRGGIVGSAFVRQTAADAVAAPASASAGSQTAVAEPAAARTE